MRINKYIASSGICSRRKADELIKNGNVKVNGRTLTAPGYDVSPGDDVSVNGENISVSEKKVYYLFNKPTGCVTSVSDDKGRPTVIDYFSGLEERVFPVGRLDFNTAGALFVTNDGDFAYKVTHPSNEVEKVYRVRIAGNLTKEELSTLRHGVDIGGYTTKRAKVDLISWTKHSTLIEVTIHEGRNRQVRRMFKAVGKDVQELTRISEAGIGIGRLRPGQYRKLNPGEVEKLMRL